MNAMILDCFYSSSVNLYWLGALKVNQYELWFTLWLLICQGHQGTSLLCLLVWIPDFSSVAFLLATIDKEVCVCVTTTFTITLTSHSLFLPLTQTFYIPWISM